MTVSELGGYRHS
ncbi:hypothetical protein D046_1583A, partial [Vibrio parahaemolyticus V-223/04]